MSSTRKPGSAGLNDDPGRGVTPSRTPGSLGINDQGDPNRWATLGDTPGPAGVAGHHTLLKCTIVWEAMKSRKLIQPQSVHQSKRHAIQLDPSHAPKIVHKTSNRHADLQAERPRLDTTNRQATVQTANVHAGPITAQQLTRIMTHAGQRAQRYLGPMNRAMAEFHIDNPRRQAAFLAQIAHESGEFRWMRELASGAEYEGRKDLGNTHPGDGRRYKGRGPIQLTGRANYRRVGRALGVDLENHPELAESPGVAFRIAAYYWQTHGLNRLADQGQFREITHRINGGYRGEAQREHYYHRALEVLAGGADGHPAGRGR